MNLPPVTEILFSFCYECDTKPSHYRDIEKSGTSCSATKFCSTTLISVILLLPCLQIYS